jgi:hypothetical protein
MSFLNNIYKNKMPISTWGPPTWIFLHTFAEKIKDDAEFRLVKQDIWNFIVQICKNLPCPTCSAHSSNILKKVNVEMIKSKQDLKNVLFLFHNAVNQSKGKPAFQLSDLDESYKSNKLIETYNNFINIFQTKGNMSLLTDSFQRKILVAKLKSWIQTNYKFFII